MHLSVPGAEARLFHIQRTLGLALPIGWVDSPNFSCPFSETLTDVANALVDTDLLVLSYGAISDIPETGPPPPTPPHTPESLTHIDFYMDDVISAVQGDPYRQH